ncbi:MAG: hypothetical protein LBB72_05755 [Spirochaetaceae bacterium]|jgi:hypothetical protein|nr:hypothetical protein [Spirochaetaceae bacterium]
MEMISDSGKRGSRFAASVFCLYFCIFFLIGAVPLGSLEIRQGHASLFLFEDSGRFSFYCLNEAERSYETFLADKDPRTSFIELNINGRIYRLGESPAFNFRLETGGISPALVFESETLRVRQEFTFLQTSGSGDTNGIRMTIHLTNLQPRQINVGARILLNTRLAGRADGSAFFINNQGIGVETVIAGSIDRYWASHSGQLSFMGSIKALSGESPDYLHIGDWTLLSDAVWASGQGRTANSRTNALKNPAICYYYNPKSLPQGGEISYSILLAAEDQAGFNHSRLSTVIPSPSTENSKEADLALLASIMKRLGQFMNGEIEIPEQELINMEQTITRIRKLYGLNE